MSVGLGCECVVVVGGGVIMIREEGGRGGGRGGLWLLSAGCISDTLELDFFIHSLTTLTIH